MKLYNLALVISNLVPSIWEFHGLPQNQSLCSKRWDKTRQFFFGLPWLWNFLLHIYKKSNMCVPIPVVVHIMHVIMWADILNCTWYQYHFQAPSNILLFKNYSPHYIHWAGDFSLSSHFNKMHVEICNHFWRINQKPTHELESQSLSKQESAEVWRCRAHQASIRHIFDLLLCFTISANAILPTYWTIEWYSQWPIGS